MKRVVRISMGLCLLVALCACDSSPDVVEPVARPVKTYTVSGNDLGRQWTFSGTAEDALATPLSFRVGGKIIQFPGDQIGRKFAHGQIIAKLDPTDYELQLRQARADMEQVRANYVRAKADMKRNSELFERHVISRGELDQIEADFKSYEAQLSAVSKKLDIARKQLSYTTLEAPFDGWIGQVKAHKHQNVASGESVVTLNAGRDMKMYIAVPDTYISQVNEGSKVKVWFDAVPGQEMEGEVAEISVDSSSGSTYPVKVYLANKDRLIRSGMSGHVTFEGKVVGKGGALVPPVAVVGNTDGTRSVWVVDPATSSVTRRDVSVGQLTAHGLEVLEGVKPGDQVVIRGMGRMKEGLKVRLMTQNTEG